MPLTSRHHWKRFALLALVLCAPLLAGELHHYAIDPVHTRVVFTIDHAGFSRAIGTISGSQGSLYFDPDDWSSARLDVRVPMDRLDMGDSGWTASVLAPRFLDVHHYPQAHLVVNQLTRSEAEDESKSESPHGHACGALTLHGVTRPLCMEVTLNRSGHYPLPPFRRTLGFSATTTLKRSDYGMTRWQSLVGDTVELRIEAELHRSGNPESVTTTPPPSTDP